MAEIPLVMPKMSMTMTEGIFVAWHKQPGDEVRSGDVVAEVTTDKVDMEVESPVDGVLARLVAEPEDVVPVGEPIAFLTSDSDDLLGDLLDGPAPDPATDGEPAPKPDAAAPADDDAGTDGDDAADAAAPTSDGVAAEPHTDAEAPAEPRPDAGKDAEAEAGDDRPAPENRSASGDRAATDGRPARAAASARRAPSATAPSTTAPERNGWVPSVPLARARAEELGVDLASVTGTGPDGVVRVVDVEGAAPPSSRPHPAVAAVRPPRRRCGRPAAARRRAALARRTTESAAVPQFVVFRDLDLEALAAARGEIGWTAVLLTAFASVLRDDPVLHAVWEGDRRQPCDDDVVVSVAVDTPDGLLGPSLPAPDRMSLAEVDEALAALTARAHSGKLTIADLTPGTTTVCDLGGLGVAAFSTLLTPPQATALTLGAVGPVSVAVPGGLGVRVRCRVGLVVDHRVADGADAARLLERLQQRCDDPASLGL